MACQSFSEYVKCLYNPLSNVLTIGYLTINLINWKDSIIKKVHEKDNEILGAAKSQSIVAHRPSYMAEENNSALPFIYFVYEQNS